MYTEEERAKWRKMFKLWKETGELPWNAGIRKEQPDATTVQKQEPVQPIKRTIGKSVVPKNWVEKKQKEQPVIKEGNTYKVKPRPQTFAGRVALVIGKDWVKTDAESAAISMGLSLIPAVGPALSAAWGAPDFGYDLNESMHNYTDQEAHGNTAMSGLALLPYVRGGLKMLKGKTWTDRLRNAYDLFMTRYNASKDVNKALKTARVSDAMLDGTGGILDKAIQEAKKFDWVDNDTYSRWFFNGQNVPEFKYVWHGRGTNRGNPYHSLRTYSDKDVGLHITENKATAKTFAKNKGVVYEGIDYGQYPDAIYSDINTWTAKDWKIWLEKALQITPELEKKAMSIFNPSVVDKDYGKIKSIRDIARQHDIQYEDVVDFAKMHTAAGTDWVEREEANKKFADYLRAHHVNFRYKNDFEGGGYQKPSAFISDPSDIRWIPKIKAAQNVFQMLPILNWQTGKLSNFRDLHKFAEYIPTLPLPF